MNITEARRQFDLVLSVENGKDIPQHSEQDITKDDDDELLDDEITMTIATSPRKRRRRGTKVTYEPGHIMRLYDRSINLDHLTPSSTLYSACREWMKNRPTELVAGGRSRALSAPDPAATPDYCEIEADSDTVLCYDCTDTSPYPNIEIPKIIEGGSIPTKDEADIKTLRNMNIQRWKAVRERWRDTYEENYKAHIECVNIIKRLYTPAAPASASSTTS